MRAGAVKVASRGSYWWFDETTHEYLRLPKHEQPRERPEWSDESAGPLQDARWHPFTAWRIGPYRWDDDVLIIDIPVGGPVFAPQAERMCDR